MTQDWIAALAQDIKQKNHEAAEEYGRAQHRASIVAHGGPAFFAELVTCVQQDVAELRSELQGDVTSADIAVQAVSFLQLKLTRSRFPWVDAQLTYQDSGIILQFAKGIGTPADPSLTPDRITRNFTLVANPDDTLHAEDTFAEPPIQYPHPQDLARRITEILFSV